MTPDVAAHTRYVLTSAGLQHLRPLLFRKVDVETTEPVATSYLGTPVFDQVELWDEDEPGSAIVLPLALVDVAKRKLIHKTKIQGRPGTVKEYISDDDWHVVIRGTLVSSHKDRYPEEMAKLRDLLKKKKPLAIHSQFLELWEINTVVVEYHRLPQERGRMSMQYFEIVCASDEPFELELNDA